MRKPTMYLIALLLILALMLSGCAASAGLKDKIVGKYTTEMFGEDTLSSLEQLGLTMPEGDHTVYAEFTKDGVMRPVVGDKDLATWIQEVTKDLSDEIKSTMTDFSQAFSFPYSVKDEKTVSFTFNGETQDLTAAWEGDVLTLTDPDGKSMTFTKVK